MAEPRVRLAAEFGGTAFLLAVVVGSGIMAERLSDGNEAIALLANSVATGAGLFALIISLQHFGAQFNPAVTLLSLARRELGPALAAQVIAMQVAGGIAGVLCAHAMFGDPLLQVGDNARTGWPLAFAELVATAGLLAVVSLAPRRSVAAAVAAYITAAYWFTASTSFANPAVTVARAFTTSFAGIAWIAVPGFIAAQLAAVALFAVPAWRRRDSSAA